MKSMITTLAAALALLGAACQAGAQTAPAPGPKPGSLGIGILLGDPTSASFKYWLDGRQAIDAGVGVSENLVLHGDYVYHGWELTPQPSRGRLAAYLALGGRLEFEDQTDFGIRLVPGLSYWPRMATRSAELFLELGPVIRLTNGVRGTVDGGFGFRFYFDRK